MVSVTWRHTLTLTDNEISLKCPVTAHWKCLASTQKEEVIKAARERDRAEWLSEQPPLEDCEPEYDIEKDGPRKRKDISIDEMTGFLCGMSFI